MKPAIRHDFDVTELDAALGDIKRRRKQLTPAFRDLRKPLRMDQRRHAIDQEGPEGKWPRRSALVERRRMAEARSARKRRKAWRPRAAPKRRVSRRLLGRLPAAIVVKAGALFVRATSRAAWSGIHQEGGRAGRRRAVEIPARPFLWPSSALLEIAREVLGRYVIKGWKR